MSNTGIAATAKTNAHQFIAVLGGTSGRMPPITVGTPSDWYEGCTEVSHQAGRNATCPDSDCIEAGSQDSLSPSGLTADCISAGNSVVPDPIGFRAGCIAAGRQTLRIPTGRNAGCIEVWNRGEPFPSAPYAGCIFVWPERATPREQDLRTQRSTRVLSVSTVS
jgi:hypothetical protein